MLKPHYNRLFIPWHAMYCRRGSLIHATCNNRFILKNVRWRSLLHCAYYTGVSLFSSAPLRIREVDQHIAQHNAISMGEMIGIIDLDFVDKHTVATVQISHIEAIGRTEYLGMLRSEERRVGKECRS